MIEVDWELYEEKPEEKHDFHWAIEQLKEGKKVRMNCWHIDSYIFLDRVVKDEYGDNILMSEDIINANYELYRVRRLSK
jgi:hypothetical protein